MGTLGIATPAGAAAGGTTTATADVYGQLVDPETGEPDAEDGERERYAADAATLRRTPNGISPKVEMPTPEPGTYHYGDGTVEGHPEAFTLWVFADGVPYAGAGHVVGGDTLTLSGHVSKNTDPFGGADPPEDVAEAEVHVTIAPHGALDPEELPDQIKTPEATPAHWWFAEFED